MIIDIEWEFSFDSEIFWVEKKGRVWEFHDPICEPYFLIFSNRLATRLNFVLLLHPIVTVSFPQMIKLVPIKNFCFPLCPDQHRGNGRSWYPRKAKLICNLQIPLIPSLLLDTNNSLLSVPTHLTKRLLPM